MYDLIIVGGGPSGLSCAIEGRKASLSVVVLEKGSVVDAIRRFPQNLVWFSTPELLEIGGIPFVTSTVRPTRVDTLSYYQKVVQHYKLDCRYFDAAESVARAGTALKVTAASGIVYEGRNVVLATGYYDNPNRLNVAGECLPNVMHYYNEPFKYFDCDVAVVGGRNSAVEAALDLFRHGARVTLIHRGEALSPGIKYWILPDIENRIKAGEVKALFRSTVREIRPNAVIINTAGDEQELKVGFTFVLIGFHPDTEHLRRFGIDIDPETLAPCFDERTFETSVPGLYVAGSLVAGKNNNKVFVENGRLHGGVIVKSVLSKR
jgi:thioredoxin reductase (NADPH)